MKKLCKHLLSCFLLVSLVTCIFSSNAFATYVPSDEERYSSIEAAVSAAENKVFSLYQNDLQDALKNGTMDEYYSLLATADIERHQAVDQVYSSFGFEKIYEASPPDTKSTSSVLSWTSETCYYDSTYQEYVYSVDWEWEYGQWDDLSDIEDIAGVYMTNSNDYYIAASFAKTWGNGNNQTGYVDNTGNHTPSNSYITKRAETADGVLFNVNDYVLLEGVPVAPTHKGRMTIMVKLKSGVSGTPQNKIISSYEHNYKYAAINLGATISSVGFNSITGNVSVSYNRVNGRWLRASGGYIIGS